MRRQDGRVVLAAMVLAVTGVGLFGCGPGGRTSQKKQQLLAQPPANPCTGTGQNVALTPTVPLQFSSFGAQLGADCMAWQTFIALNWAADPNNPGHPNPNAPASAFGTPGDTSPKVWESYLEASAVFNPVSQTGALWKAARPAVKQLSRTSKFGMVDLSLSDIGQAGDGKWLTSQAGGLTYYEVRINQDEFEFITTNVFSGSDLTTYAGQAACAGQAGQAGKGGFNLPGGGGASGATLDVDCMGNPKIYGQNQGAIEIKASWIALPADHSLDYRYKTAVAQITDPFGHVSQVTVGLVGLHILHKTPGAPQFVWATFEQIDNSPDEGGAGGFTAPTLPANPNQKPRSAYAFFNPNCTAASDPTYNCVHNQLPGTPCDASGQPAGCDPYTAPMQVTRIVPVDTNANSVTGYVWSLLPSQSVFNYYRLANVMWPNSPMAVAPQSTIPLPTGDITPPDNAGRVANTTLETYQQTQNSCMDCHKFASIAQTGQRTVMKIAGKNVSKVRPVAKSGANATYASDYSFIFASETVK
ncbi:MAG TPA: hypothetical protein VEL74_14315 [Thermoanaerobaculia bacterium]|nr:hypothetical protein [Thermoanaerobaculia bacterium]